MCAFLTEIIALRIKIKRMTSQLPEVDKFIEDFIKDQNENGLADFDDHNSMENFPYADSKDFLHDELPVTSGTSTIGTPCGNVDSNNSFLPFNNQHQYLNTSMPSSVGMIPANEEFPGIYNFDIILNTSKKFNWVYSKSLNKVFINMGQPLPVVFRWVPAIPDLYVRATPLFSLTQHTQERVTRCLNHSSSTDISNKDVPEYVFQHVIRCTHPSTRYCCDVNGRFSIITPLGEPQAGTDYVRLMYKFMCKNSCASGMNRRPIEIVYTLESHSGDILGRRKHEVRICSCPKRDKDKEEDESKGGTKKRKVPHSQLSYSKKICAKEDIDTSTHSLTLQIIGKENARTIIKLAYDIMAGNALRQNAYELYKPYLEEIDKKRRNLEQSRS